MGQLPEDPASRHRRIQEGYVLLSDRAVPGLPLLELPEPEDRLWSLIVVVLGAAMVVAVLFATGVD